MWRGHRVPGAERVWYVDRRGLGGLAAGLAAAVILPAARAPPGSSSSHLRYWQTCANALYIRDRVVGGDGLAPACATAMAGAFRHGRVKYQAMPSQTGCELRAATAGDLALCIGWIALDGGNLPLARSLYGEARQLAAGAGDTLLTARFLPRLVPEQKFEFIKESTGRKNTRRFPDPTNRSHLIAALAYEFVKTGPVLMFCAQTNFAESCAKALADRIELAELTGETAPDCFTRSRYPSADIAAAWLGGDDPITKMLRVGVAVHHGRLPDAVRRAVRTTTGPAASRSSLPPQHSAKASTFRCAPFSSTASGAETKTTTKPASPRVTTGTSRDAQDAPVSRPTASLCISCSTSVTTTTCGSSSTGQTALSRSPAPCSRSSTTWWRNESPQRTHLPNSTLV